MGQTIVGVPADPHLPFTGSAPTVLDDGTVWVDPLPSSPDLTGPGVGRFQQTHWPLFRGGPLYVRAGDWRVFNDSGRPQWLRTIRMSLIDVNTGSDLVVDVLLDRVSVFADQGRRPRISAGAPTATSITAFPSGLVWPMRAALTVDVKEVGSTTPGTDLQIQIMTEA